MVKEEWNYPGNNPTWKTNYKCFISKNGLWRIESKKYGKNIFGKWVFLVEPKETKGSFPSPTFADQNNFMSGLLEVEWNNDCFKFCDNSTRCSSFGYEPTKFFKDRLRLFQQTLDFYKNKYNGQTKLGDYCEEN